MKTLDAEEGGHFVVEEAAAGLIGLDPFSVEDELGDGALAGVGDDVVGGAGDGFDVDLVEGDGVGGEEAFGLAAVAAPGGGVEEQFHGSILRCAVLGVARTVDLLGNRAAYGGMTISGTDKAFVGFALVSIL